MNFRIYLIIIFILIAGLIGYFLVWPEYQELLIVQSEIEGTQEKIQSIDKRLADLKDASRELEQYKDQLKILDYALPNRFYLPQIYDFFGYICPQRGLTFGGVNASVGPSSDFNIREVLISLNASGDYSTIKNFLSYLESSARFFAISNINLSSSGEPGALLNLSLNLKTYAR